MRIFVDKTRILASLLNSQIQGLVTSVHIGNIQWIAFKERFTGNPHDLNLKIDGFRWRFSQKPIHWEMEVLQRSAACGGTSPSKAHCESSLSPANDGFHSAWLLRCFLTCFYGPICAHAPISLYIYIYIYIYIIIGWWFETCFIRHMGSPIFFMALRCLINGWTAK